MSLQKYINRILHMPYVWVIYAFGALFFHFIDLQTKPRCLGFMPYFGKGRIATFLLFILISLMLIFCFMQFACNFKNAIKQRQKLNKRKMIINSSLVLLLGVILYFLGFPFPPDPNNLLSISSCTI